MTGVGGVFVFAGAISAPAGGAPAFILAAGAVGGTGAAVVFGTIESTTDFVERDENTVSEMQVIANTPAMTFVIC